MNKIFKKILLFPGALSLFKEARVYLPREEEQLISGETGRFLFFGNRIDMKDYELLDKKEKGSET
ncbi:MAG: hypothetical protein MUP53_03180 [Bacteroidales bacterium]|nr:hypothetical protein [Bacteroidales bacterium]